MVTDDELRQIMPTLPAARRAELLPALQQAMEEFGINTKLREAAFLATLAVESGELRLMVENLNYSAQRLLQVFPKYFKTAAQANEYGRQPEKIANRVYASRMGNGDEASGDGWRYRGRGVIQITGRSNYRTHGRSVGVDIESNPDLAADPVVAFRIAGAFWQSNNCNRLADQPNFGATQKAVNGRFPPHGWPQRQQYYNRALQVLSSGDQAPAPTPSVTRGLPADAASGASTSAASPSRTAPSGLSRGLYPGEEFSADAPAERAGGAASSGKSAGKGGAKKAAGKAGAAKKGGAQKAAASKSGKSAAKKSAAKRSPAKAGAKKAAAKKSAAKKAGAKKSGKKGGAKRRPARA